MKNIRVSSVILATVVTLQGCVDAITHAESFFYGVTFRDTPVGYFEQRIFHSELLQNIKVFESLTIATNAIPPHSRHKSYLFSSIGPQKLLSATVRHGFSQDDSSSFSIEFDRLVEEAGTSFLFTDLLRGRDEKLTPNTKHTYKRLGGSSSNVVETNWMVMTETSSVDQTNDLITNTLIVDDRGCIKRIQTGAVEYVLIEGQEARESWRNSIRSPFNVALEIPVVGEIPQPRAVSSLRLKFVSRNGEPNAWDFYLDESRVLDSESFPSIDLRDERRWIKRMPRSENAVQRLDDIVAGLPLAENSTELSHTLVNLVHEYLDYQDLESSPDLDELLDTKVGDCTEYAELFRSLAVRAGLTSRIVYGIVYEPATHTFRPHAWNEVEVDTAWIAVDPTFNQTEVDATHIPFPTDHHALLLYDLRDIEVHVLEVGHQS